MGFILFLWAVKWPILAQISDFEKFPKCSIHKNYYSCVSKLCAPLTQLMSTL